MGIFAALAIPRLTGSRERAANNTDLANVKTLRSAVTIAIADHGAPADAVTWDDDTDTGTAPHLWADYLDSWPEVPSGATNQDAYKVSIDTDGVATISKGDTELDADWDPND